jgi:hypothetical protein
VVSHRIETRDLDGRRRWFKDRAAGYQRRMADQEQREQESRETDVTKFEELADDVREEREDAAQRIGEPLEPQDE